jgi:adenylate cyclase class 2
LFDDDRGSLRLEGRVLRLRRAAGRAVLTYKGPGVIEQGVKTREEREVTVSDADELQRILAALGLSPRFRFQKYRESYRQGGAEVVVDETPIGTFLEIEGSPEQIHAVAAALGYSRSDYVLESYPALFFASGGTGDMLFERQG